jgi:hypothetical protein
VDIAQLAASGLGSLGDLIAQVTLNPDSSALPGKNALQQIANGIAGLGLIFCAGAMAFNGARMSMGKRTHNVGMTSDGKEGLIAAFLGAIVIGGAAALVNGASEIGRAI